MKKKSLIFAACVLASSVVFANTSYAKSITKKITAVFDSYIVKVNGKTQKTTTLANGSTVYVPINDVSKLTGASVKKSGHTYNITPVKKEDGITRKNVDELKIMVFFMDMYETFNADANALSYLNRKLDLAKDDIQLNNSINTLDDAANIYNEYVGYHDSNKDYINSIEKNAKSHTYSYISDDKNFKSLQDKYSNALSHFLDAINDLKQYNQTRDQSSLSSYYSDSLRALDYVSDMSDEANKEYQNYFSRISKK